ncbi:hypothetical protein AC579_4563 [Pseudocercospora musae]|uniref:YDG domain-containing protein n=1 Tax=Pseudocercospora musae TaxID=113226 RepID=A0A139IU47_9PEZI|nr:hypothetical protein AC579_4563 [Pseudocercospora musae]
MSSDPIWGVGGPMFGLAYKKQESAEEEHKKSCKSFGNNDGGRELQVGKWFPRQLTAASQGYHGRSQAGIHGASELGGAYFTVISRSYIDVNDDQGDVIYYPGPESKTQKKGDPVTLCGGSAQLMVNLSTKPVRVFRAGGPLWTFELTRREGQMPLDQLTSIPTEE